MNIERGFPNPKHGNGDSWNSVARGMPIPHESAIRCTHDSWTTSMAGESGENTSTPKGPIPLNNEWISTNELGSTINPEEPTPIGNGIVHKANDCKPVTPGNSFPRGIGRSKNSWTPVTPEKLINEKSDTNPVGVQQNQSESDNWRDLIGMYTGLLKEVTPGQNKGVTSVPYLKTNDPANWKCNLLASIVCSKSSNEAQNNVILLPNKPRGLQVQRNTSMRSTSSKDGASSSTVTDSFQFAPITPAKHNNNQHVQEIPNFTIQETNNDSPPSAISTTQKQQIVPEDKDKDEHNIGLSKTPNQKTPTRRRKHRPRVIKPQKPEKDPKTGTTTTTPGETRVKRKCVRKQGVNISETKGPNVVKRKYVRKKGIDKFEGQQKTTVDNSSVKSCKKKLNFDLDHVEQDKSHDIINKKHDINLNVNPQDIQQERRMMSLPVNVINVPIAKTTRHVPIVSSFILDEKRGNKRQGSDMNSLLKRKYVRKKGIDKFEGQQTTTVDNSSVKSCKKKLNFDLDHVEQDKSQDIINKKHDINLNVNPQDIQQERRMMSLPVNVINVPIAKTTRHVPIVSSFILDEKRGNKRQSSDMNSLLLYQKLLLGVAHRAHDRNIFMENHKKRKIMQSQFQDNLKTQMNNGIYNGSVMQILHPFSQKVNPTIQPPMSTMQPYMIRSVPERLQVGWNQTPPVPTKEGIKYGVITYPASVYNQCIKKDEVSVEYVTYKLEQLHINSDKRKGVKKNELVVYRGSDAIVPFEPIKKRNQRPKVDLDPDTERVWRLLMGKEGSEGGEWVDEDKEKWWENERRVFRGRADSFIARMHLVQGDRRFSRWKGSVVDSVIGVFLTQNVSDHLSSSAFMLLAAKFPLKTNCKDGGCDEVEEKKDIIKIEEKIKSEDSVESTIIQTIDEIRSSSGSNSEAEDLTGHVVNDAKKQNTNSKEENASHEAGANMSSKEKKRMAEDERNRAMDWDSLRKEAVSNGEKKEENKDAARDSLDYEALRHAPVNEISEVIKERGMNNLLAERMKEFLNRVVRDHGKIDLEWLRDAPPDKAKEYLLSFRGLGLKSVECVRLLTLHHLAFPVDTNVGRIAVRLGWVPLQPLPESLQLHLLEMYPVLDSIQKYLWPRLCKLDQLTLYELHYQMITFGKVFCTKSKPNCNACPMRAECRHFASAFASARLALPGPEEKRIVTSDAPITKDPIPPVVITPMPLPPSETDFNKSDKNCEPIIEEPTTPEPEPTELSLSDIEDQYYEDSDEIPSIKLNMEEFTTNLQNIIQDNKQLQDDMSKALVALKPNAAYIPTPKLKDVSRLRTEHQVYELPDSHRLLEGLEKREPDDPSPYLLAIWTPGETANSIQPPERECLAQESGKLCDKTTCFSCNNIKEANSQVVRGTILIPCRTAMRGSFPLNGTYFQVNEMFADHASSLNPIDVPRSWIWNLPRRTVYFGTSVSTIFRGLSTHGIQYCFWKGFVCVRGFDRETRAPRPLMARLHFSPSKLIKIKNEGK